MCKRISPHCFCVFILKLCLDDGPKRLLWTLLESFWTAKLSKFFISFYPSNFLGILRQIDKPLRPWMSPITINKWLEHGETTCVDVRGKKAIKRVRCCATLESWPRSFSFGENCFLFHDELRIIVEKSGNTVLMRISLTRLPDKQRQSVSHFNKFQRLSFPNFVIWSEKKFWESHLLWALILFFNIEYQLVKRQNYSTITLNSIPMIMDE